MMKKSKVVLTVLGILVAALLLSQSVNANRRGKHHKGMAFAMYDSNKDGKISMKEWMQHFRMMDANKNGFISKKEMHKHHGKHRRGHGKHKH